MNRPEVLSANRLRLHAFTGLALHVEDSRLYSLTSKGIVDVRLLVSEYADGIDIRYSALPIGSCVVLVLDDASIHSSVFTDTADSIRYDLSYITDEDSYYNIIKALGVQRYAVGCICDTNQERLAKVVIDLIFEGNCGLYSDAGRLKQVLNNYAYLAEPYLEGYGAGWLERATSVFNSTTIRLQLKNVLRSNGVDFSFLRGLHILLKTLTADCYFNNLITYSLFISDSRLYMVEQLREFLVKYYRGGSNDRCNVRDW